MNICGIKTSHFTPDELLSSFLDRYLPTLHERTVVAITSKIISFSEHRLISKDEVNNRKQLIQQHSDQIFPQASLNTSFYLTLKWQRLIPNAGIDESNGDGHFVLPPQDPMASAVAIWHHLRKQHHLKTCGVIITDSNVTPLRTGVYGIALGWCGFKPIYSYRGQPDLFQRPLQASTVNLIDNLATAATLVMGEGAESTPLALLTELPQTINFTDHPPTTEELASVVIDPDQDLFNYHE